MAVVPASLAAVAEGQTTQLTGAAALDYSSLLNVRGRGAVVSGERVDHRHQQRRGGHGGQGVHQCPGDSAGHMAGPHKRSDADSVLNTHVTPPGDTVPDPLFTPQDFATARTGLYQGLLKDGSGNVVGAITGLNLLSTRAFTSKVVFNGITYSLSGSVAVDGSFSGSILRTGKTPLAVTLQLGTTADGGLTLRGTVTGDNTTGNGFIAQAPIPRLIPPQPHW